LVVAWLWRIAWWSMKRRWLSEQEFADIVSLCQFLPGPNIVGIAVCTGTRLGGAAGALAAAAGFLVLPWLLGFAIGALFLEHAQHPVLQKILSGLSATAAGLLTATGIRLLLPHRRRLSALLFAMLAFGLVIFGKFPLLAVLFGLVPISIAVASLQRTHAR
jgi:chromate transporter